MRLVGRTFAILAAALVVVGVWLIVIKNIVMEVITVLNKTHRLSAVLSPFVALLVASCGEGDRTMEQEHDY